LSVFDSKKGDYELVKSVKLKQIQHHLTSVDYSDATQKIIVSTLNEKIQLHSVDPEVSQTEKFKLRERPSGHFLFEADENKCSVFSVKYCERDGSRFVASTNTGFDLCDVETQW
jgi:hypothetical protein